MKKPEDRRPEQRERQMKRAKKTLPKGIRTLPGGQYLVDIRDSQNRRHRKQFDTLNEADSYRETVIKQKKTEGGFLATAANTTFGQLLDLLLEAKKGTVSAGRVRTLWSMCNTLKAAFGARPLADFDDEQMRFVQEWLDTVPSEDYRQNMRTNISMAFKLAVQRRIVSQSPLEVWGLTVRRDDDEGEEDLEEKVLTVEQSAAIVAASKRRSDREQYLVAGMRHMLVMIMLFTGMRPQAACGLCWDCMDLRERRIYVRRKVLRSGELVRGTKIGRGGFATLPMSPPLHAALLEWRDRLCEHGFPTEGDVPVLRTLNSAIVNPHHFSTGAGRKGGHWSSIIRKAGLVDDRGASPFTAYCLRHTYANCLRAIGLDIEDVKRLMTHQKIKTTSESYIHFAPHLAVLRREVDRVIADLHLDRTVEAKIDALGIVLARRWRDLGCEMPCSPPHAANVLDAPDHPGELAALPAPAGNVIELRPGEYTSTTPEPEPSVPPVTRGIAGYRNWQFSEIKRMRKEGKTKADIRAELHVSDSTISEALRSADELRDLHAMPLNKRRDLRKRCREHFESGRYTTYREIGLVEHVRPMVVRQWAVEDGWRARDDRGKPRKLVDDVPERIIEMFQRGMHAAAIARATGLSNPTVLGLLRVHGLMASTADRQLEWADTKARIIKQLELGKSQRSIAAAEGVNKNTVWKIAQQLKENRQSQADDGSEWTVDPAESA